MKSWLFLPLAAFAAVAVADAQSAQLDAATFRVTVGGVAAGHETVEITRHATGEGSAIEIKSRRQQAGVETVSKLVTEADGRPRQIEIGVRGRNGAGPSVMARVAAGKLSVQTRSPGGGEAIKDFIAASGTIMADDDLVGPYYAVPLAGARSGLTLVLPRDGRQETTVLRQTGTEQLQIGDFSITATRWVLGEGDATRELWTDAAGKLLKLEIASRKLVALRSDVPR